MKRFKCTVERTDEYIIEFDENVINDEWMKAFSSYMWNVTDYEELAEHLAQYRARFPEQDFIEGFGRVKVNGSVPFEFGEKSPRDAGEDAVNIKVVSEDSMYNMNVDVEEID